MCSISGIVNLTESQATDQYLVLTDAALTVSKYRGPDHSSSVTFSYAVLGHNRLSILDLSAAANQPMADASGRYYIVLNGEIFNHLELKRELEMQGCKFQTSGDTEVLLQLLIHEGKKALNKLNGFFAFAFYDSATRYCLIARDRMGEKPLFYYHDDEKFCFASTLKSLLQYELPREVDTTSLSFLLQFSYLPSTSSLLRDVHKLEPGCCLEIIKDKQTSLQKGRWYKPVVPTLTKYDSEQSVVSAFKELLDDAVQRRLYSDVSLGCFLSGGVDSSIVAMLAARHRSDLPTFSIGFSDGQFIDETKYAKEVATHIGTKHEAIVISTQDLANAFEQMVPTMDEPFADSSAIALWMLCMFAKTHISVALSGDGADELLGGYNKHAALIRSQSSNVSNRLLPALLPLLNHLPDGRSNSLSNKTRQLKRFASGLDKSFEKRYIYWSSFAEPEMLNDLVLQLNTTERAERLNYLLGDLKKDDLNAMLIAEQRLVLAGDMLPKVDMASMAHGLEIRPPFLDHRVVEFVNSLDASYKLNGSKGKILLQKCFAHQLPASVFNRPKKGFEIPLERLLRRELKSMVMDSLSETEIARYPLLNGQKVKMILEDFYTYRRGRNTALIYTLLVFQLWCNRWLR